MILLIQDSPSPSPVTVGKNSDLKPAGGSNTESPAPDTSSPPVDPKKPNKTNINTPDTTLANPPSETGQKEDSKENCDGLSGSRFCENNNMIACIKSFRIGMKHCSLSLSLSLSLSMFVVLLN